MDSVNAVAYGSDQCGLVCGYLFGRTPRPLPIGALDAAAWLRGRSAAPDEFIWLHFNLANTVSEKWLREHLALEDEFYDCLHAGSRSTRIEQAGTTLVAVVNDVLRDFSFEPSDIASLVLSVERQVVISARRSPLQSVERLRQAVLRGEPMGSSLVLLTHLLRDQADVLIRIVRDATGRVDGIEDNLLSGQLKYKRADLGALRRVLVRLQRLLAPEPAALFRLLQRPPSWVRDTDRQELREASEEFAVALNDIASLQERIKLLQEEIAALVNEANNRSLYVLTIVTVLALPINIIAGLLGMNVGGIPLASDSGGFWIIAGIVAAFTGVAGWIVARKRRELD
ncbi:transporter [Pseudoduganella armeniaca]|uniref:Magnesium transporter CorA n=1 Tax=Pseudoduganella armeniaca TaxID=2072590 RepID=A0A2R4C6Z0_9BURK|nr:transporter [Pseudoduganella armeniaca]AVR95308.1 magnesium transporter CorA [Pseudoduganella armeniaca]